MNSFNAPYAPLEVAGAIWAQGYRFALIRSDKPDVRPWAFYKTRPQAEHAQACAPYTCALVPLSFAPVHVPIRAPL